MTPQEIVAIARETIGTKYQHQCRVNGVALDCAGVPVHVADRIGVSTEKFTGYGRQPMPDEMKRALDASLIRVHSKDDMQIGDVVWITFRRDPQHFAIVGDYHLGGFSLIHAYNGAGLREVVEHRMDDDWRRRIVGVWRFPGVEA